MHQHRSKARLGFRSLLTAFMHAVTLADLYHL